MDPATLAALGSLGGKAAGLLGGLFGGGDDEPYIPPELMEGLRFDRQLNTQIGGILGDLRNPLSSPLAARLIAAGELSAGKRFKTLRTKQNVGLGRKLLRGSTFAGEREAALTREEGEAFGQIPVNVGQFITQNLLQQLSGLSGARTGAGSAIAGLRIAGREKSDANRAALFEQLGGMFGGAGVGGLFGGQTRFGAGKGALLGAISPDSAGLLPFMKNYTSSVGSLAS
jgi:hypothetical protein